MSKEARQKELKRDSIAYTIFGIIYVILGIMCYIKSGDSDLIIFILGGFILIFFGFKSKKLYNRNRDEK